MVVADEQISFLPRASGILQLGGFADTVLHCFDHLSLSQLLEIIRDVYASLFNYPSRISSQDLTKFRGSR